MLGTSKLNLNPSVLKELQCYLSIIYRAVIILGYFNFFVILICSQL
jgi:hypothetical protein